MIGEIENRSSFLLAVKADVETQGDFVQSLATEVRAASFTNIEDLVAFVNWLDEELSFLVDERASSSTLIGQRGGAKCICPVTHTRYGSFSLQGIWHPVDWLLDSGVVGKFAGGFDAESMKAFEELRSRAHAQTTEENKAEAS
ncbi:UNVERIFIED_CONTAM: protein CHUP1, chloroplastic [Sesamum radiatum]|uniref:Protein CHUP1, chloroplastic n=1 Tax=Sesamum radiatum TaxID=300843 RepID=A0AAW2VM06_SESRA